MHRNISEKPYVTYIIIAINIIMYVISVILTISLTNSGLDGIVSVDNRILVLLGAKYNPCIIAGQYYRLITCTFLHAGIVHIFFNMYALYSVGPFIEKAFGRIKFMLIYFISGITSSLFSFIFFGDGISIGASGAIFGLFGAMLVFAIKYKNRIGKQFMINILGLIAINLIMGATIPNIDNYGHIGGLLGGVIVTLIIFIKLKKSSVKVEQ